MKQLLYLICMFPAAANLVTVELNSIAKATNCKRDTKVTNLIAKTCNFHDTFTKTQETVVQYCLIRLTVNLRRSHFVPARSFATDLL